jgi:hypothetical protein
MKYRRTKEVAEMRYPEDITVENQNIEQQDTHTPTVLAFGEAARFVTQVRDFIFTHGDQDAVADYKTSIQTWRDDKLPPKEMLEMELVVQRDVFKKPHESLLQFGFKDLLDEFRANRLDRVVDGFDDVVIEEPSMVTTATNLVKKGLIETSKDVAASAPYYRFLLN